MDNLIKPIHSLGKLEDIAVRLAGITGKIKPGKLNKAIIIMAGDTAVDGENKTGGKTSLTEVQMVSRGLGTVSAVLVRLVLRCILLMWGWNRIPMT